MPFFLRRAFWGEWKIRKPLPTSGVSVRVSRDHAGPARGRVRLRQSFMSDQRRAIAFFISPAARLAMRLPARKKFSFASYRKNLSPCPIRVGFWRFGVGFLNFIHLRKRRGGSHLPLSMFVFHLSFLIAEHPRYSPCLSYFRGESSVSRQLVLTSCSRG